MGASISALEPMITKVGSSYDFLNNLACPNESTFEDAANGGLMADTEYYFMEILIDAGVISIYTYDWVTDSTVTPPNETQDRSIAPLTFGTDATAMDISKTLVDIDAPAGGGYNGLWNVLTAYGLVQLYMYWKWYEMLNTEWKLMSPPTLRDTGTDVLVSTPPVDTDKGQLIILDDFKTSTKVVGMFYITSNIAANPVRIPWEVVVRNVSNQ